MSTAELYDAVERISQLVDAVRADERRIGVYSTGERIAVAFVLNRADLLDYGTILESIERLGETWLKAAMIVSKRRSPA